MKTKCYYKGHEVHIINVDENDRASIIDNETIKKVDKKDIIVVENYDGTGITASESIALGCFLLIVVAIIYFIIRII